MVKQLRILCCAGMLAVFSACSDEGPAEAEAETEADSILKRAQDDRAKKREARRAKREAVENRNVARCTISGGKGGSYEATGKNVSMGGLPPKKGDRAISALVLNIKDPARKANIHAGFIDLDLDSRSEQEGSAMSGAAFNSDGPNPENWEDDFASILRANIYDGPDLLDSKVYFTLREVEELPDDYLRLVGTTRFKASNIPKEIPEAAALDLFNHKGRVPAYDPKLMGTTDIAVNCDFEIAVPVIPDLSGLLR